MSRRIKDIKDKNTGELIYPRTHASAVVLSSNSTLEDIIEVKQDKLISGTNIKTINGDSILGEGNISIRGCNVYTWTIPTDSDGNEIHQGTITLDEYNSIRNADVLYINNTPCSFVKEDELVVAIVGTVALPWLANFTVQFVNTGAYVIDMYESEIPTNTSLLTNDSNFVSSTNLKTINGESILGSGNIVISGDGSSNANVQAVDTGDVIDDVTVDYATKTYVAGLVGDINSTIGNINSVLESIINGADSPVIITFTVDGTEYQAEEGMTFYDWGMSKYYDSSINLVVNISSDSNFNESCQNYGNTPTECYTHVGYKYTPNILLNSVIQPIAYVRQLPQGQ